MAVKITTFEGGMYVCVYSLYLWELSSETFENH